MALGTRDSSRALLPITHARERVGAVQQVVPCAQQAVALVQAELPSKVGSYHGEHLAACAGRLLHQRPRPPAGGAQQPEFARSCLVPLAPFPPAPHAHSPCLHTPGWRVQHECARLLLLCPLLQAVLDGGTPMAVDAGDRCAAARELDQREGLDL